MCSTCKKLRETEIGYKTKVALSENAEIILDRYKDHDDVFIHASFTDNNGGWLNTAFDVAFCPFCGQAF